MMIKSVKKSRKKKKFPIAVHCLMRPAGLGSVFDFVCYFKKTPTIKKTPKKLERIWDVSGAHLTNAPILKNIFFC